LDVLLVGVGGLLGGLHLVGAADGGRHVLLQLFVADALVRGDVDVRVHAGLAHEPLLGGPGGQVEDRGTGVGDGEGGDPGDLRGVRADRADHTDLVTDLQMVLVGGVGVDHDLGRALGRRTGGDLHGAGVVAVPAAHDGGRAALGGQVVLG